MPLIAGYIRISQATDESTSVAAQTALVSQWAASQGHELQLYVDEGVSGSRDVERPAFDRMVLDLQAGLISKVVVKSIDRLGRNLKRFVDFDLECKTHGASIFAIEQNLDTGQAQGKLMLQLLSTFAEFEAEQIGQRIRTSMAYRVATGRAIGAPPLGYRNVTRDGGQYREIDPEQAQIVHTAVTAVIAGESLRGVARILNQQNLLPVSGVQWHPARIRETCTNPTIVGMRKMGKDVYRDDSGVPVIDKDLQIVTMREWQAVQKALGKRATHQIQGQASKTQMLSGLAVCDTCGGKLRRSGSRHGKGEYRCFNRSSRLKPCQGPVIISEKILESYVTEQVEPLLDLPAVSMIAETDPVAEERKILLDAEVTLLSNSLGKLDPELIAEAAERLTGLVRQRDDIVVGEVVTRVETGQTLRDLWDKDPKIVLEQAILQINVKRGRTNRVVITWNDSTPEYF